MSTYREPNGNTSLGEAGSTKDRPAHGNDSRSSSRYYYLDAARAILMTLGIFIHAADVYSVRSPWIVHDVQTGRFFDILGWTIHLFRMPSFYMIAGFFCAFSLRRYGVLAFLKLRSIRIGVPLVVTALLINNCQALFQLWFQRAHPLSAPWPISSVKSIWLNGTWLFHLWFLVYLLLYLYIAAGAFHFAPSVIDRVRTELARVPEPVILMAMPFASLCAHAVVVVAPMLKTSILGFIQIPLFLDYSPFFAYGYFCFVRGNRVFCSRWTAAVWLLALGVGGSIPDVLDGRGILGNYCYYAQTWGASLLCLTVFQKCLNRTSSAFRSLSDASYSIYLFHHIIVVVLGALLVDMAWVGAPAKFATVVIATFAAGLILHKYAVSRYRLLSLLFNGRTTLPGESQNRPHKSSGSDRCGSSLAKQPSRIRKNSLQQVTGEMM